MQQIIAKTIVVPCVDCGNMFMASLVRIYVALRSNENVRDSRIAPVYIDCKPRFCNFVALPYLLTRLLMQSMKAL